MAVHAVQNVLHACMHLRNMYARRKVYLREANCSWQILVSLGLRSQGHHCQCPGEQSDRLLIRLMAQRRTLNDGMSGERDQSGAAEIMVRQIIPAQQHEAGVQRPKAINLAVTWAR